MYNLLKLFLSVVIITIKMNVWSVIILLFDDDYKHRGGANGVKIYENKLFYNEDEAIRYINEYFLKFVIREKEDDIKESLAKSEDDIQHIVEDVDVSKDGWKEKVKLHPNEADDIDVTHFLQRTYLEGEYCDYKLDYQLEQVEILGKPEQN